MALKESRSYVQMSKPYLKKIEKIEKDLKKRQTELKYSLFTEIERSVEEAERRKYRKEKKSELKQAFKSKFSLFKSDRSRSSSDLMSSGYTDSESSRIDQELTNSKRLIQKSHVKLMIEANREAQAMIKEAKILSIELVI